MRPFNFFKGETLKDLLLQKNENSAFLAGGTNLVDLMKKNIYQPEKLLFIAGGLSSEIISNNGGITIGAMATNSDIANHKDVIKSHPILSKAILAGASPQIRNMATAGGNILQRTRCPYFYDTTLPCNKREPGSGCGAIEGDQRMSAITGYSNQCVAVHPSDMCVALVALDAEVAVEGRTGSDIIAFDDFLRLPGNNPAKDNNLPQDFLITAIHIKPNKFQKHTAYVKLRDRTSYAFALVSVAACLDLDGNMIRDVRLASGGVAHKPWRWKKAEAFLMGKAADTENFEQAAAMIVDETMPLPGNKFKQLLLNGAVITALQRAKAGA